MPQVINMNIASLNAQRNLNQSQSALQTSLHLPDPWSEPGRPQRERRDLAVADR